MSRTEWANKCVQAHTSTDKVTRWLRLRYRYATTGCVSYALLAPSIVTVLVLAPYPAPIRPLFFRPCFPYNCYA